jgi:hypothetical protein
MNKKKLVLGLLLAVVSCAMVQAQRPRVVYLGDARVDGGADHDTIRVGAVDGTFRAIQLAVTGGSVRFDRVVVRYGNGSKEELSIRRRIADGGRTRVIDLPGDRRVIQSVDLWYGKDNWRTRPRVQLFGVR